MVRVVLPLLFVALATSSAFSADFVAKEKLPVYKRPAPESVCSPASELDQSTGSCEDNHVFLEHAQECWDKVQKMHNQVTKELKERIGNGATTGQSQGFHTSALDQQEAKAAHDFMMKFTQTALDDLDKYFDFVVQPEDVETDAEILETACYRDAVVPMDDIAEKMEDKLQEMKSSKGMEDVMGKTSSSREANTNTLNAPAAAGAPGKGAPAAAKKGKSKNGASTITGLEIDEKKASAPPKK